MPVTSQLPQLRVIEGGAVLLEPVTADPWEFQAACPAQNHGDAGRPADLLFSG